MRERPLFVPVMLDVLLMGKPGKEEVLADFTPNYSMLDENNLFGDQITNSGFASKQGLPGAHLHWTMPDALLKGRQAADGSIEFPELPNRWIVMRFEVGAHRDRVKRKVWLVQSDAVTYTDGRTKEGIQKTAIPCLRYDESAGIWMPAGKDGAYYAFLGSEGELSARDDKEAERFEKLTAVGAGDPLFCAFYPLCQTVFGFYDSLAEETAGTYTYMVCGYYDRETSDPFYGVDAQKIAAQLGWEWEKGEEAPDSVVCHGTVFDVCWQGSEHGYIDRKGAHLDLVLANTSAEALSCYLQNRVPEVRGMERMLNALMDGLLEEFDNSDQSDSLICLEDALHERQFGYSGAGESFRLQTLGKNTGADGNSSLSGDEEQVVRQVQKLAEQANQAHRCKESYGETVYYCWHQYIRCLTSPFSSEGADVAKEKLQQAQKGFWEEAEKERTCADALQMQVEAANEMLGKKGLGLVEVPERNFAYPNPPVLLMVEEEKERVCREGFQKDENGKLPCRMRTAHALVVELPESSVTLDAKEVETLCEEVTGTLPAAARALGVETILLGAPFVGILARAALEKSGIPETKERLDETETLIKDAQNRLDDRPFEIALREWEMPWNPIMMEWQVEVTPARTSRKDNTFDFFELGEIDFEASDTAFAGEKITVSGQTLLTPHAPLLLKKRLKKLVEDYGETSGEYMKLKEFAQKLQERQILSQQLTGFSEALQGLRFVPAIPPLPVPGKEETKKLAASVQDVMNHIYPVTRPGMDPTNFLPLRGCTMQLSRFRLIDQFGQYRDVDVSEYYMAVSEALRCDREHTALLPPRFPGGTRLIYHWMSAEDANKRSLGEASTPICGFLFVNVFDHNLQVYDVKGQFLGWLQRTDECIKWRQASGMSRKPEDIPDRQLRLFVLGVLGWEDAVFERLLAQTDRHFSKRSVAGGTENPALCLGNILVLARAAFLMEEEGLHRKFWGQEEVCTNDYEKEEFPLKLGDERRSREGLVGFFVDKDGKEDYDRLYLCSEEEELQKEQLLYLTLEDSTRTVTLLLDPYGEVTLRTGFLPVLRERLSPELYRAQMDGIKPLFHLWPFLSPADEIVLPMTEIAGRSLEITWIGKGQKVNVQELKRGLPSLLPGTRQEILEGYLSWKEKGES